MQLAMAHVSVSQERRSVSEPAPGQGVSCMYIKVESLSPVTHLSTL